MKDINDKKLYREQSPVDWQIIEDVETYLNYKFEHGHYIDWETISHCQSLSEGFIRKFKDKVDWDHISEYQKLSEDFIKEFQDKVNWDLISYNQILSDDFIRLFKNKISWYNISIYQNLSIDFIREFKNKINWDFITKKILSENLIREFKEYVDWNNISFSRILSEDFIREFQDKINWTYISKYQKLSEDFIREFQDKVDWCYISAYQKLSENFIREFQDKVDWLYISTYQKLSENFIREFKNKVDWTEISKCQKLSFRTFLISILLFKCNLFSFIKYQKILPNYVKYLIGKFNDNWLYKTTNFKKQQIIECGLYECHEDYFIANKAIRKDRYSTYNFQYQYLPNETYQCHCDCTDNDISFGLSVWTFDNAKNYNDSGLIVKVKVRYEDVGILLYDNKIRCSKIEVLE